MGSRRVSRFPFAIAVLVAAMLSTARAGEPSARDLIALAPVLDSADGGCRSLDVAGYLGDAKDPGPRLRFRALYRAPDRFSLLISDADGTPLVFCSGREMLVYDPVGPTVYYSEGASFNLGLAYSNGEVKFKFDYFLRSRKPHHILVDLRSVLSGLSDAGRAAGAGIEDRVVRCNAGEFELIRSFQDKSRVTFHVVPAKECPYTAVAFAWDDTTSLCFDRLALNGALGDELFAFPAKGHLPRGLPVRDVTAEDGEVASLSTSAVVGRASIVRSVLNKAARPRPDEIPGLSGVDWARVEENDRKFAKALRDLVPASLRRADGHRD